MSKKLCSLLLTACLLLSLVIPARAVETETDTPVEEAIPQEQVTKLYIATAEEFLAFAENCRLDSYSRNLEVWLDGDIDLRGTDFAGVPVFCGTFYGRFHTITVDITAQGSNLGLFRYLTETALVQGLTVEGTVAPQGSRSNVGGLVGHNAGTVRAVTFNGCVDGAGNVGGIAGVNTLTGIIELCKVSGQVSGSHFVGGVAGSNRGVIRKSENSADINTTALQNSVELSDITLETITNSEAANTVTDIGGIAGASSGVIRDCSNDGDVGYRQMGYNIGGIAGSQSGYIVNCENSGQVHGRKEVGGIVGQLEPAARLDYSEDTLQILKAQMGEMGAIAEQTASGTQSSIGSINSQINAIEDYAKDANDAIDRLIPDADNPRLSDEDALTAAQNAVSSSVTGMSNSLQSIAASAEAAIGGLNSGLGALSGQMGKINETINNAAENLGISVRDVSDEDTAEELTGKVENCVNTGHILADRNAGGIAGAISLENDMDPEDDLQINGDISLNSESELRSVILGCGNRGRVTVKKQNGGGIVGRMALGLVKACVNTGAVEGEKADYVGGIAGMGGGFIRSCGVRAILSGSTYVGGIAGRAPVITDCRSMVHFAAGAEKTGAVLGAVDEKAATVAVSGNVYLSLENDPGAIDGISYAGLAEPMALEEFMALEGLDDAFRQVRVQFVADGKAVTVMLAPGEALTDDRIPPVPEKDGSIGVWEGLEEADLDRVGYDMVFTAAYTGRNQTIQSQMLREENAPLLMAQGRFTAEQELIVAESGLVPELAKGQTVLENRSFAVTAGGTVEKLRLALDQGWEPDRLKLLVRPAEGVWREVAFRITDSYLVFEVAPDDAGFCVVQLPADRQPVLYAGLGIAGAALIAGAVLLLRKRKKKTSA